MKPRPCKREGKVIADSEALQHHDDRRNDAAHDLLISGVYEELLGLASSMADETEYSRIAMRLWKTEFGHETTTLTLNIFTSFLDLRFNEGDDLLKNLFNIDTAFPHISSPCSHSERPEAKTLAESPSVDTSSNYAPAITPSVNR
ncbi:hypothetical protein K3495_g6626 [Podosphaera aphanis]|nr:hypothetical protein K3495_g6626 [Podosphaera aphanis]